MIARLIRPIFLLTASFSFLLAQSTVGEWEHLFSSAQVRAVIYADQKAYLATAAGVIVYDAQLAQLSKIGLDEGLVYPDINALAISENRLWLGGAAPLGIIQLYDLETGKIEVFDLGVDEIIEICVNGSRTYAAYRHGQNFGLMEFKYSSGRFRFADTYSNFPASISEIVDFDIQNDTLYLSANTTVFYADTRSSNLKDPANWTVLPALDGTSIIKVHANADGLYYMDQERVYKYATSGWAIEWEFEHGTVYDLVGDDEGNILLTRYGRIYSFGPDGNLVVSSDVGQRVLDYAVAPGLNGGFAAVKDRGLAFYDNEKQSWIELYINDVLGQNYTSIIRLKDGTLVVAGLPGIAYRKDDVWYNILPGYDLRTEAGSSHINDFSNVNGTGFYADTLYYRAKQSWNMLEMSDGSVLIGFKGNAAAVTPMLQFHPDNIADFTTYDTTAQKLDGLIEGYVTIRHITEDQVGNVWIVNPFAELHGNTLAVIKTDGAWEHFSVTESSDRLNLVPTEIAFDNQSRVWIGSQEDSHWHSGGGLVMLDYGSLGTKDDDVWTSLYTKQDPDDSNTIWSLAFDKKGVLWLLTPQGVIGYNVEPGPILRPFTQFGYFLGDIPFEEGSKIRIDARNNKWITSPSQGVWILLDNTTFWPDVNGFNAENSNLLSSEILDLYISDEEGLVYFATAKGISILRTPFKEEYKNQPDLKIFPSPFLIPSATPLTIEGLLSNSSVKIFTMNGALVRELTDMAGEVTGYQALWDGRNQSGSLVGSGVYLVAGFQTGGGSVVGKVAVIRR